VAGLTPPAAAIEAAAAAGVDLTGHRSRTITADLVTSADLTVAMTRRQLVELCVLAPDRWERCFTLAELTRRAADAPPIGGQPPSVWAGQVGAARTREEILALPPGEDVEDPDPERPDAVAAAFAVIQGHLARLVPWLCPV
jgi:protein-tyrosine phosphatase